jgi:hypothetical protein
MEIVSKRSVNKMQNILLSRHVTSLFLVGSSDAQHGEAWLVSVFKKRHSSQKLVWFLIVRETGSHGILGLLRHCQSKRLFIRVSSIVKSTFGSCVACKPRVTNHRLKDLEILGMWNTWPSLGSQPGEGLAWMECEVGFVGAGMTQRAPDSSAHR